MQFAPFKSFIDASFFQELSRIKLNDLKLSETEIEIEGVYSTSLVDDRSPIVSFNNSSFNEYNSSIHNQQTNTVSSNSIQCVSLGKIRNFNTIEAFKKFDKSKLMKEIGEEIYFDTQNGEIIFNPSLLTRFYLITFSDIKKYKFYYWFSFPVISTEVRLVGEEEEEDADLVKTGSISMIDEGDTTKINNAIKMWTVGSSKEQWGFFLIKKVGNEYEVSSLKNHQAFFEDIPVEERKYGFRDPSTIAEIPGWPLRNFLVFLSVKFNVSKTSILSYRDSPNSTGKSFWINISSLEPPARMYEEDNSRIQTNRKTRYIYSKENSFINPNLPDLTSNLSLYPADLKVIGWERNSQNKLAPKLSDLGSLIDPRLLADQAVDLNLKLMKWRIAPSINLDIIKNNSCLLLGAGTLGSYIGRALLGWGVRRITFVDNGKVSFSNPVRQSLYKFKDCLEGGSIKAETAAQALKEIYPLVQSQGYSIEIPMAGHPISNEQRQESDYNQLIKLIEEHDTIFLLMDSRESRWLPTVIASSLNKLVINVALGFDSYVVMRHGISPSLTQHSPHLGCYFCNDVVAPVDSISNQTLDQMCTVTRPGVALLASATAVELLTSLLQHRMKGLAPASNNGDEDGDDDSNINPLSKTPHQIRGFLHNFEAMKIWGPAYDKCSACSGKITDAWKTEGWSFVKKALSDPDYVSELSGLAELQRQTQELDVGVDWDTGSEVEID